MSARLPRLTALALACAAGCASPTGARTFEGAAPRAASTAATAAWATDWSRSTIYHSPQTPGYTAWVGGWVMPDGSLMTAFTQATGPVDPSERQLMPERELEQGFGYTEQPDKSPPYTALDPHRDFWGLQQSVVYLRSADGGQSWQPWRSDPFQALSPQAYTPQADIALSDGTLIRRVSGMDLLNDPTIPHEALLETLKFDPATSGEQAAQWSSPRPILRDPSVCTYQISRIHQLSDGRLIALGGVWPYAADASGQCSSQASSDLLLVAASASAAEQGQWSLGMRYTNQVVPDEWDAAELPNGDLLALMRTEVGGQPARMQAVLTRSGSGWVMQTPTAPPDLPAFQPSGHPDLLATREGAILSISSTGTAYTLDGGRTWSELSFADAPEWDLRTRYYPYAIQARDGTIYVFSHNGWDIAYGEFNESIVMDRFKLHTNAPAPPSTVTTPPKVPTPPATNHRLITASHASLAGLTGRAPKLAFTLTAASPAVAIRTLTIALPAGLSFSARNLRIAVRDALARAVGVRVVRRTARQLTLVLARTVPTLQVTISGHSLLPSAWLTRSVKHRRKRTLTITLRATDATFVTTRLSIVLALGFPRRPEPLVRRKQRPL